ncbi:hypothetical protein GC170_00795 [bacterium]|nr:hypothetical protein [bacterium]
MTSKEFASELEQFHNSPRMTSEEIVAELKRLHADQDTTNFGVYDFISAFGTPLEAVMYSKLFWPDFIEIEGMVIRSEVIEDESDRSRIINSLQLCNYEAQEVEYSYNRMDIPYGIFATRRALECSDSIMGEMLKTLVDMWASRLSQLFQDRRFKVALEIDDDGTYFITACQHSVGQS